MFEIIPNWHPVLVHFSISLFIVSALAFVVAGFAKTYNIKYAARTYGRVSLWLAFIAILLTVAAGFQAYNTVTHDGPSHESMKIHRNWAFSVLALVTVLFFWSIYYVKKQREESGIFTALGIIGIVLVVITAWWGGELVFRHGLGVMSLPQTSSTGHHHEAGVDSGHHSSIDMDMNQEQKKPQTHEHSDGHNHTH